MNLRFWGGWFLAIACVCIFLTMGCEKGSLGVKTATVFGRVVNKDNVSMGVPNATIRMVSKEAVSGGGDLDQGYNFLSTVSDADGYFIFEKVQPDNVIFEFTAPGYRKATYPETSSSSSDDSGDSGGESDIESVTISNGSNVDLRNVLMEKVAQTVPSTINVKLDFVDKNSKKPVDDNEFFAVTFDGVSYSDAKRAKWWRETGLSGVLGAQSIAVGIRNDVDPVLYNPASMTINGMMDQYITVELEPVTYNITCQFIGVPQYLLASTKNKPVLKFLVEDYSTVPPQNINIVDVTDFTQLATLQIPAIRSPQNIRLRMQGYEDEVIRLDTLVSGDKGSYRLDIDFQAEDGCKGDDTPLTPNVLNGKVGMYDNIIRTDIVVDIIGLAQNDKADIVANFVPQSGITWSQSFDGKGLANADGEIIATLNDCPTYFDMTYTVVVYPQNVASPSYIISSGNNPVVIGVPEKDGGAPIVVINAAKVEQSSTNNSGGDGGSGE